MNLRLVVVSCSRSGSDSRSSGLLKNGQGVSLAGFNDPPLL